MDKYEEMARRIGSSSPVDKLLTSTNLSYSTEIMVMPLLPKFKVPQVKIYDWSKDPIEHLRHLRLT